MIPFDLHTPRLLLDQPVEDDIDAITEYCQDPVFERYLTVPWPYEREHAESFVREFVPGGWANGREFTWAMRNPDDGALLGMIGTRRKGEQLWDFGYWLGGPHRGKGLVPEAATAVLDRMFADGRCDVMRWEAVVGNGASLSVARGLGFRFTGIAPAFVEGRDGSHPDSWHAELRADDPRSPRDGWPL